MSEWLSIEESAKYLKLGKTNLYALVKEGRVPGNKIGKKWVFEKQQLDAWVRANRPLESFFVDSEYNIDENERIRESQKEAHTALYQFFKDGGKKAIVQIPIACGKSTLASIIPFGIARGHVLIVSQSAALADQLLESMDVTNRQECFWRKRRVLSGHDLAAGPYAALLDPEDPSASRKSHIAIANLEQAAADPDGWLDVFDTDLFDLVILDEADRDHLEGLDAIGIRFPNAKLVQLTSMKLGADENPFEGELVYRYPFKRAMVGGLIKNIKTTYVEPSIPVFTTTSDAKIYTLEEISELNEEDWFGLGVGLSEESTQNIVEKSLEKLQELRQSGTQHGLIAFACSVDHAISVRSKYSASGFSAEIVHADMSGEKRATILKGFRSGEIDCIVQAQMIGKRFDHNKLSVAAVFRPFRSFLSFIHFVSQVLPVIRDGKADHPDNRGYIVTHSGLGLKDRLLEIKDLQRDDRDFWEDVIRKSNDQ